MHCSTNTIHRYKHHAYKHRYKHHKKYIIIVISWTPRIELLSYQPGEGAPDQSDGATRHYTRITTIISRERNFKYVSSTLICIHRIFGRLTPTLNSIMSAREFTRVCASLGEFMRVCVSLCESVRVCVSLREFTQVCASSCKSVPDYLYKRPIALMSASVCHWTAQG